MILFSLNHKLWFLTWRRSAWANAFLRASKKSPPNQTIWDDILTGSLKAPHRYKPHGKMVTSTKTLIRSEIVLRSRSIVYTIPFAVFKIKPSGLQCIGESLPLLGELNSLDVHHWPTTTLIVTTTTAKRSQRNQFALFGANFLCCLLHHH